MDTLNATLILRNSPSKSAGKLSLFGCVNLCDPPQLPLVPPTALCVTTFQHEGQQEELVLSPQIDKPGSDGFSAEFGGSFLRIGAAFSSPGGWKGVIFLLISTCLYLVKTCPSSCAVCTEEATICQGLAHIIAVPSKTKILIITGGNITSIGPKNFSHLLHLTLLKLTGNEIHQIQEGVFTKLCKLRTLVLDHNQISSTNFIYTIFLPLGNLEILQLNNNYFASIDQTWFNGTNKLLRLEINRNHITNLTFGSLGSRALHLLQYLELSDNFIGFIQEGTFKNLQSLKVLDLSKNRLTTLPDIFPSLPHLSLLNLGQNRWNCTCKLKWVADFLRNSTRLSPRTSHYGNGLQCSYSRDPRVKSLLQLTERNCLFKSQNISFAVKETDSGELAEAIFISILVIAGIIALSCFIVIIVKCILYPYIFQTHHPKCCCERVRDIPEVRIPTTHLRHHEEVGHVTSLTDTPANGEMFMNTKPTSLYPAQNWPESDTCYKSNRKDSLPGTYYICFKCRLLQWHPPCSIAMSDSNEIGRISKSIQGVPEHLKDSGHAGQCNGTNTTTVLQEWTRFNKGNTSIRRSSFSKEKGSGIEPNTHVPESYHTALEPGQRKMASHQQRADVMSRLTTKGSVEMKIHAAGPPLCAHRSQGGGHGVLPDERRDISQASDNDLICKYMECDKLEEARRQTSDPETRNVKFEEKKIQTRVTKENCFLNNDGMVLPARIKKVNIPRSVGFYIPNIRQELNMEVNTPQSQQEGFSHPHLGSKYVLTINKKDYEAEELRHTKTLVDSLKDVYINGNVCGTEYTERQQNYLRVKVNLQPFRKVRVHPQHSSGGGPEATKQGQSPKPIQPQLRKKKLKGGSSLSAYGVTQLTSQNTTQLNDPSKANCVFSKNKTIPDKKPKQKTARSVTLLDSRTNESNYATIRPLKGRPDDGPSLEPATIAGEMLNTSKNRCLQDKLLKSESDQKRNISTEQRGHHAELGDQEIPDRNEELTEDKLRKQCESLVTAPDRTSTNVTVISGGADSLSCGYNIRCEMDIAASSLLGNKVNGHFEDNREDDITGVGCLLRADNSIKNISINEAADREVELDTDILPDKTVAGKMGSISGSDKEDHVLVGEKKAKMDTEGHVRTVSDMNSKIQPGSEDDLLNSVDNAQAKKNTQKNIKTVSNMNLESQPGAEDGLLSSVDDVRAKKNTQDNVKTLSEMNLESQPGAEDGLSSSADDVQLRTGKNVQAHYTPLMQGTRVNKLDETTAGQEQVNKPPLKAGDSTLASQRESQLTARNEELLIPRQINETSDSAPKTAELPAATDSHTSLGCPPHSEPHNSNNNRSKPPVEARRKRLSLSETSKVIIVVESLNKTIDIQKYLSERSSGRPTGHNADPACKEDEGAPGDGSKRKKICLILPEKANTGAPKPSSRKIK